jgi:hypothetical protein
LAVRHDDRAERQPKTLDRTGLVNQGLPSHFLTVSGGVALKSPDSHARASENAGLPISSQRPHSASLLASRCLSATLRRRSRRHDDCPLAAVAVRPSPRPNLRSDSAHAGQSYPGPAGLPAQQPSGVPSLQLSPWARVRVVSGAYPFALPACPFDRSAPWN